MTTTTVPPPTLPAREPVPRGAWAFDGFLVVGLLVAAAELRYQPLAPHSLWIDDAWVSLLYKVHSVADVRRISVASPGFVAMLKVWFRVVGFSNLRAQAPAFAFGILGPPALYLTARRWRLGRAAALLAGGLLVVSPVHMRYSARVKAFTLEALVATVVLLVADRVLSQPLRKERWYAFAGAAAAATALSAPLALVAVPGFLAAFVAARRTHERVPRAALTATGGYAVFSLFWYAVAIRGAIDKNLVLYWNKYYISHRSVGAFVSSAYRGFDRLAHGFDPLPTVATLIALAVSLAWLIRVRPDRAVLLFGPIALAAGAAVLHRNPFGGGRTDIYLYADLALILACGADALFTRVPPLVAVAATMAGVVAIGTLSLPVPAYPKEDFRAMLQTVHKELRPDDAILLYPKARFAAALYTDWPFHLRGPIPGASVTTPFDVVIDEPGVYVPLDTVPVHFSTAIRDALATHQRVWYIGTHGGSDYDDPAKLFEAAGLVIHRRRGFAPHYFAQLWIRPPAKATP